MHYTPSTIPDEAIKAIAPGFDRFGLHKAETWIQKCRDGVAQLWRFNNVWAITEVIECELSRICHIVSLAGEYEQTIMDEIERFAKVQGCKSVHFTGRRGWEKVLPDYGLIAIVMQKEIK